MEDRKKIQKKIDELNTGLKKPVWDEVDGFSMLPSLKLDKSTNSYAVYPANGISVKVFVNTQTGEVRSWWADKFMKEDK